MTSVFLVILIFFKTPFAVPVSRCAEVKRQWVWTFFCLLAEKDASKSRPETEIFFFGQVGHEISSIFTGYFRWILIYLDDTRVSDGLVRDGRSHDGYTATRSSGCRQRPSQECSNLGMNSVHRSVFFLILGLFWDYSYAVDGLYEYTIGHYGSNGYCNIIFSIPIELANGI